MSHRDSAIHARLGAEETPNITCSSQRRCWSHGQSRHLLARGHRDPQRTECSPAQGDFGTWGGIQKWGARGGLGRGLFQVLLSHWVRSGHPTVRRVKTARKCAGKFSTDVHRDLTSSCTWGRTAPALLLAGSSSSERAWWAGGWTGVPGVSLQQQRPTRRGCVCECNPQDKAAGA